MPRMNTDGLLECARRGDAAALADLCAGYRRAIGQTITLRLDRRLAARVDVSDVIQETFVEAVRRIPDYLRKPSMPFPLWLRWLARERVLVQHRKHLRAGRRAIGREAPALPADSSASLVRGLLDKRPSPSQAIVTAEAVEQLRQALGKLDEDERDLILWRHFEGLTNAEIAQMLSISDAAAGKRYLRALHHLKILLTALGVAGLE
jgi:RNA polymerase sigma-70 factor (ECF subfamily)